MTLGSFSHGALIDLSPDDLGRMLELDETLFVEHKADIGEESAYQLVRAVASFANTVGGWLLIGVTDRRPNGNAARWVDPEGSPTLVDAVRTKLIGQIDPLPPFEARTITHSDGPVGVVRVYESSDTPHVLLANGAVFIREVAGASDASDPRPSGGGAHAERIYKAAAIRSQAQLVELASRGRDARKRVDALLDPLQPLPLITEGLNLHISQEGDVRMRPVGGDPGQVVVRLVPYTVLPRFRPWTTTVDAASTLIEVAEDLSDLHGLAPTWVIPDPSGATLRIENWKNERHVDATGVPTSQNFRLAIDGAGVVGAAAEFGQPEQRGPRPWVKLDELASRYIQPVIKAASDLLTCAEFLGRARCQIDLIGLNNMMMMSEGQGQSPVGPAWIPTSADLSLPTTDAELEAISLRASYAYGRSAGIQAWDPPLAQ